MDGSDTNKGWVPSTDEWQGAPARKSSYNQYLISNCINQVETTHHGCVITYNDDNTALIDSAASLTLRHTQAPADKKK
eukprot:4159996-Ditylum_brightwellii.AAC.1